MTLTPPAHLFYDSHLICTPVLKLLLDWHVVFITALTQPACCIYYSSHSTGMPRLLQLSLDWHALFLQLSLNWHAAFLQLSLDWHARFITDLTRPACPVFTALTRPACPILELSLDIFDLYYDSLDVYALFYGSHLTCTPCFVTLSVKVNGQSECRQTRI